MWPAPSQFHAPRAAQVRHSAQQSATTSSQFLAPVVCLLIQNQFFPQRLLRFLRLTRRPRHLIWDPPTSIPELGKMLVLRWLLNVASGWAFAV